MILMLLAALGALASFATSAGPAFGSEPGTQVVELWRSYGYLVFAGLFVLLALRPRRYPGVWELVIFHKLALTISAVGLIPEAEGARTIIVFDGLVAVFLISSYLLARGYSAWSTLRVR